jgi:hypothetical protein
MVSIWFGGLMVLIVFSGFIAFAFTNFMNDRLFGNQRLVFTLVLLAYSIYRGIRLYQTIKQIKNEG